LRVDIQDPPGGVMHHHGIGDLVDISVQAFFARLEGRLHMFPASHIVLGSAQP